MLRPYIFVEMPKFPRFFCLSQGFLFPPHFSREAAQGGVGDVDGVNCA